MKKAVFPGSFDPITIGHIDIIQRASHIFEDLTVLVANSTSKKYLFSIAERTQMIKEALIAPNIKVESYSGLLASYCQTQGVNYLVRGVRTTLDFEYERSMAELNVQLNPKLETVTLFSSPKLSSISSTAVKEIAQLGGSVDAFLAPNVNQALNQKLK